MPKQCFENLQKGLSVIGLLSPDFIHKTVESGEYHVPALCLTGGSVLSQWLKSLVPRGENNVCELPLEVQHMNLMWCLSSEAGNCMSSDKAAARKTCTFSFPRKLMTCVT